MRGVATRGGRRRVRSRRTSWTKPLSAATLWIVAAALSLHVFAWGRLAPVMVVVPIEGLCTVAQYPAPTAGNPGGGPQESGPGDGKASPVNLNHCALSLLAQGLTAAPDAPTATTPAASFHPVFIIAATTADYVGWFLSTRRARGPPHAPVQRWSEPA